MPICLETTPATAVEWASAAECLEAAGLPLTAGAAWRHAHDADPALPSLPAAADRLSLLGDASLARALDRQPAVSEDVTLLRDARAALAEDRDRSAMEALVAVANGCAARGAVLDPACDGARLGMSVVYAELARPEALLELPPVWPELDLYPQFALLDAWARGRTEDPTGARKAVRAARKGFVPELPLVEARLDPDPRRAVRRLDAGIRRVRADREAITAWQASHEGLAGARTWDLPRPIDEDLGGNVAVDLAEDADLAMYGELERASGELPAVAALVDEQRRLLRAALADAVSVALARRLARIDDALLEAERLRAALSAGEDPGPFASPLSWSALDYGG